MHWKGTRFQALTAVTVVVMVLAALFSSGIARLLLIGAAAACYILIVSLGVFLLCLQLFGPSVCRARVTGKVVALTFDDGPDPACTPALLDLLKEKRVPATFFCTGKAVRKNPSLAARESVEGHLVENHSDSHSHLMNLFGVKRLRGEMMSAQEAIRLATGRAPVFYRPPVGLSNPRVFRAAGELGLVVVGWTARGLDTTGSPAVKVLDRILRRLCPGAIILLHDGGQQLERTVGLVDKLIDMARTEGYQFVRLDELLPGAGER